MLRSLRAELIKIRRLRLPWIAIAAGVLVSLVVSVTIQSTLKRIAAESRVEMSWQNGVIGDSVVLINLAFPTLVILTTALVFFVEHRNQMWKQLRTTPQPVGSILAAKFVVVQALLILAVVSALATAVIRWRMLSPSMRHMFATSDANVFGTLASIAALLYVALLPVSIVQFGISAAMRNVLHPVGIGLALTFISLVLFGPTTALWLPYAYPGAVTMQRLTRAEANDQVVDAAYKPSLDAFTSPRAGGRVIVVDEAHGNRHGLGTPEQPGTLRWIVEPAEKAGMVVRGLYAPPSHERLPSGGLLVIAGVPRGAFGDDEARAVAGWVAAGGSLLVLTDHEPFASGVANLLALLGVQWSGTVVTEAGQGRLVFRRSEGRIADTEMTNGVESAITYGGQSISRGTADTVRVLALGRDAQLIAFPFGRGRVIVSGETALFTAQRKVRAEESIGVADRTADNERLVINAIRWLLRL